MVALTNRKIRQGAIILHIDCQAFVNFYEVSLNVPFQFPAENGYINGKRKSVSQMFTKWQDAMKFKLALQCEVAAWKIQQLENKRMDKLEYLTSFE